MDAKDQQLIHHLQHHGKTSYADLGEQVGLSITAVKERIKRLTADGVLKQNVYLANPQSLGLEVCAFVQVLMPVPSQEANFVAQMHQIEEVQECHSITGEYSYLLKVRVPNTNTLEQMMSDKITSIEGVARTNTLIALTTYKETTQLPIDLE